MTKSEQHDLAWEIALEVGALERGEPFLDAIGCPVGRSARRWLRGQLATAPAPLPRREAEAMVERLRALDPDAADSIWRLRHDELPMLDDACMQAWKAVLIRLGASRPRRSLPPAAALAQSLLDRWLVDDFDPNPVFAWPDAADPDYVVFARTEPPDSAAVYLPGLRTQHAVRTSWARFVARMTAAQIDELVAWGREQFEAGHFGWWRPELCLPDWVQPRHPERRSAERRPGA